MDKHLLLPGSIIGLIILCLLTGTVSAAYTIDEFCFDGYTKGDGDEYFILDGTGNPASWQVSDGEGTVSFSSKTGRTIVARNGELYFSIHQKYPDYEIINSLPQVPDAQVSGRFQMANTKDELKLIQNGRVVQTVSWPGDVVTGNGRIHYLSNGVWDERVLKIGQSRFAAETFSADTVTLFVSPDCSYDVITSVIDHAETSLIISMYEFTHPQIAEHVADAAGRGVEVIMLMEGGPVGGMNEDEKGVLNYLKNSGAGIYTIESKTGLPARYRYLHTKYLVADEKVTIVVSENFKESGVPVTGTVGNRGWGAAIDDVDVAQYFIRVFTDDIAGYDIHQYTAGSEPFPNSNSDEPALTLFSPVTITNVPVTPVISPDTSALILDLVTQAKKSLAIQQAYISPYPGGAENPWLTAALSAAGRGVGVRIILDGMYYNTMDDADNDELVARLNTMGQTNIKAKLMTGREGILKVHNKGVIADGRAVLISSVNWNYNSPTNNREAGVIIESEEAAAYFTKVFNFDWDGKIPSDPWSASIGFDIRFIFAGVIIAGLIIVFVIRRRR